MRLKSTEKQGMDSGPVIDTCCHRGLKSTALQGLGAGSMQRLAQETERESEAVRTSQRQRLADNEHSDDFKKTFIGVIPV